jgi:anhydro-N-acetylmuramic acid kinase
VPSHFIGLMSGTSLDGIDAVVVQQDSAAPLRVLGHAHAAFDDAYRLTLHDLNASGVDELHRAEIAANELSRQSAALVQELLARTSLDANSIRAIGAHGQTVRHRPGEFDGVGYTIQLLAPALLAELTGIDVVCDFRSRDIAAGGQGAPLVPAFHEAAFGHLAPELVVLNLGGISNITIIRDRQVRLGFDCGPGNALMDHWCQQHTSQRFDHGGRWAASGSVDRPLLSRLLADPFFSRPPPKSTGRDLFNPVWLMGRLSEQPGSRTPVQVQATLAELTARVCADSIRVHAPQATLLVVCGGGAFNTHLLEHIAAHLAPMQVRTSNDFGLPADQVEACAFAWLASAFIERRTGNLPRATGARASRVLGALYPAA